MIRLINNSRAIAFSIALTTLACSKPPTQVVSDPGPQFSVKPMEIKLMSKDSKIEIKRDDEKSGPEMQIQTKDIQTIVSSERKLECGPLVIPGKRAETPDIKVFSFHISEDEFKGLNQLPIRSPCSLSVTLTNALGSKATKSVPITINFDRHPTIFLKKITLKEVSPIVDDSFNFLVQRYQFENILPYPVGFTFRATHMGQAHSAFKVFFSMGDGSSDPAAQFYLTKRIWPIVTNRIVVEGHVTDVTGDFTRIAKFVLPPNTTATVYAFGHIPDWVQRELTRTGVQEKFSDMRTARIATLRLVGLFPVPSSWPVEEKEHSLIQWKGFVASEDDDENPLDPPFVAIEAVPREPGLPDLRDKIADIQD